MSTKKTTKKPRRMKEEDPALRFGHIPGVAVGKWWATRKDCSADRVHPPFIAGIYGRKDDGARSIVLSGTSEFDDEDHGEYFEYVGSGGRAPGNRFGPQTEDQSFENSRNKALHRSAMSKRPVRVIRGAGDSKYAPYHGYRYDGLYLVENPRLEVGPSGFKICKFDFRRMRDQDPLPMDRGPRDKSDIAARRRQYMHTLPSRRVASSSRSRAVGATRGVSSGSDDDDNADNLESLFTAPEEIEEALEPVLPQLARFSRPTNDEQQIKARRQLLLDIGDHICAVLEEKREEGEDHEWWRHELWSFVVNATPKKVHNFTVKQYEDLYKKFALKRRLRQQKAEGSNAADERNVKREPEDSAEYMLVDVDVKPKLEPEP